MKTTFTKGFRSYAEPLQFTQTYFREEAHWLNSGVLPDTPYCIVISIVTWQAREAITTLFPVINQLGLSFRMVRSEFFHYQLNGGHFGEQEIGRFLELYPIGQHDAIKAVSALLAITENFHGPVVRDYKQLSTAVFISPNIDIASPRTHRKKRLLKRKYFIAGTIHRAPKGDVRVAFMRKGLLPITVIVKQGRKYMFDDDNGRDVRDRMLWEQTVLQQLHNKIRVPRPIDFFDDAEGANLIIEFIHGKSFYQVISQLYDGNKQWHMLSSSIKKQILSYFLQAVTTTEKLHALGFIHRDQNLKNFIVEANGQLALIDLELAFDLNRQQPDPAFIIGMPGFASPEQQRFEMPTAAEDIYSLGALLFYMLTTHHPVNIENASIGTASHALSIAGVSPALTDLIHDCMAKLPLQRPSIQEISSIATSELSKL